MTDELRYRSIELDRAKADSKSRTVPASLSSEEPVDRFGSAEVLSHDTGAIDLSRAAQGLPLLFSHDKMQPIGIVEGVRIENRRLVGTLRFGQSAKAAEVFRDVQDGILRNVSIGYRVIESEQTPTGWKVTKWGPHEASVVAVAADPSVGINREFSFEKDTNMEATQTREADIRELVRIAGFETTVADELVTRNLSLDDARKDVITRLAQRSDAQNITSRRADTNSSYANPEFRVRAMVEALAYRFGGIEPGDAAREFVGMRITDMAKDLLELRGITTRGLSASQILERSLHTTGDFPGLLLGTGERILRDGYRSYTGGLKRAARETTARDFRAKQALNLSEAPALLKVNEGGEFLRGSMTEAKESYALGTYGRIFSISRQAMVNDDLQAFAEMTAKYGRAAAEFEAGYLVDLLASNPTMATDSTALFHANHGNLAGTGTVISVTSLGLATKAMRLQKGLDAATPIDATPKFLIVPAALETVALQYLATITPDTSANVNPYAGKLELIVDPRLDAKSATAWYMASDPATLSGLEYAYLEGQRGPYVEVRNGFEIDAVEIKARLDFGAGFIDHRGWYKNPGA